MHLPRTSKGADWGQPRQQLRVHLARRAATGGRRPLWSLAPWNSHARLRKYLERQLVRQGHALGFERTGTILTWLEDEIEHIDHDEPRSWKRRLSEAVTLAAHIYDAFTEEFSKFFQAEVTAGTGVSAGETAIRRRLKRHFPSAKVGQINNMAEAVLQNILDKRLHLLEQVHGRFQESLFAKQNFDRKKLRGFFVNTAKYESFHVPSDILLQQNIPAPNTAIVADDDPEQAQHSLKQLVDLLRRFWTSRNGFKSNQTNEGLASSGLGEYIDDEDVANNARDFRDRRLAEIEEERDKIRRKISLQLKHRDELKEQLKIATGEKKIKSLHTSMIEIEDKLTRYEKDLTEFRRLLQPKPREVAEILGVRIKQVRDARSKRLKREIRVLGERVKKGTHDLQTDFEAQVPEAVTKLIDTVTDHISAEPPSPSEHNLSEEEREIRAKARDDWEQRGTELTDLISEKSKRCFAERLNPCSQLCTKRF